MRLSVLSSPCMSSAFEMALIVNWYPSVSIFTSGIGAGSAFTFSSCGDCRLLDRVTLSPPSSKFESGSKLFCSERGFVSTAVA